MGDGDSKPPVDDTGHEDAPPGVAAPSTSPRTDEDDSMPPPARPPMSDDTKPPVLRKIPVPRVVKVARSSWVLSFVLGGSAVFIAFLSRDTLIVELTETLGRLAPGYDPGEVESLVNVVYWASIVGLALIITIEAVLLAFVLNRRGRARWLQFLVLLLHAGVVLVASAFIAIGDWAVVIELSILVGLVLAVAAWLLCLVPQANRWFRLKDEAQLAALG